MIFENFVKTFFALSMILDDQKIRDLIPISP